MTSAQGGRILSRSFTRRIGTRRHLLATSIASIVLALQPITSVDVRQASPPWSGVPVRVTPAQWVLQWGRWICVPPPPAYYGPYYWGPPPAIITSIPSLHWQ